jgi:hypothetical protein
MDTFFTPERFRVLLFVLSVVGVFVGAALHDKLAKRKKPNGLTDFQAFLFGTGFVYALLTLGLTVVFLVDYYTGTTLQGFLSTPDPNDLLTKVFSVSKANEGQKALLPTNFAILTIVAGAFLGGVALLVWRKVSSKRRGVTGNGLLEGYAFPKKTFFGYFADEVKTLRSQVYLPEYLLWWVLRGSLVYFLIRSIKENDSALVLIFSANLGCTFAIPLARLLFFPKLFFGNISYRVQSLLDVFIFFGNFLGHGLRFNGNVTDYDKLLHFVSGGLVVFVGCALINGTRRGKQVPKLSKTLASFGFSCLVALLWEIFEFLSDTFLSDSSNQNWWYERDPERVFFKIFGMGNPVPEEHAVLDTGIDILYAVIGSVICAAILYVALTLIERHKAKKAAAQKERETQPEPEKETVNA